MLQECPRQGESAKFGKGSVLITEASFYVTLDNYSPYVLSL